MKCVKVGAVSPGSRKAESVIQEPDTARQRKFGDEGRFTQASLFFYNLF